MGSWVIWIWSPDVIKVNFPPNFLLYKLHWRHWGLAGWPWKRSILDWHCTRSTRAHWTCTNWLHRAGWYSLHPWWHWRWPDTARVPWRRWSRAWIYWRRIVTKNLFGLIFELRKHKPPVIHHRRWNIRCDCAHVHIVDDAQCFFAGVVHAQNFLPFLRF